MTRDRCPVCHRVRYVLETNWAEASTQITECGEPCRCEEAPKRRDAFEVLEEMAKEERR